MKLIHVASIVALAAAPLAHAQSDAHDHAPGAAAHGAEKADAEGHRAKGTVKSVSAEKGTVTIAHGAVPSLKWPAMTMTFKAADRKLIENTKPGAQVNFAFQQKDKDYVITSLKPAFGSCSAECDMKHD